MQLPTLFLIIALISFILDVGAGIRANPPGPVITRVRWISVGLAFYVLSLLVTGSLKTP